jgi:hypothetical protein
VRPGYRLGGVEYDGVGGVYSSKASWLNIHTTKVTDLRKEKVKQEIRGKRTYEIYCRIRK